MKMGHTVQRKRGWTILGYGWLVTVGKTLCWDTLESPQHPWFCFQFRSIHWSILWLCTFWGTVTENLPKYSYLLVANMLITCLTPKVMGCFLKLARKISKIVRIQYKFSWGSEPPAPRLWLFWRRLLCHERGLEGSVVLPTCGSVQPQRMMRVNGAVFSQSVGWIDHDRLGFLKMANVER